MARVLWVKVETDDESRIPDLMECWQRIAADQGCALRGCVEVLGEYESDNGPDALGDVLGASAGA